MARTVKGEEPIQGFYQGAFVGLAAVLAYSAYTYNKENNEKGKITDANPLLGKSEDFALV